MHDSPQRFQSLGIDVYFGKPIFTNKETLSVTTIDGENLFTASRFVITTGSRAAIPDVQGLSEIPYLTNHNIFSLDELPTRIVILGAGPIGIELGQAMQRLGSAVTVLNVGNQILFREDAQVTAQLESQLNEEGMQIVHEAKTTLVTSTEVTVTTPTKTLKIPFDKLLVAAGRKPNVEGLGLEAAGVAYSTKGITVNKYLQTTNKRIYAVGDIVGPYQFTHMAEYQAGVVVWNISVPWRKAVDYRVVPWVTYTDPELARAGISEAEAIAERIPHKVFTVNSSAIDRAVTDGYKHGTIRLILSPKGKILGACALLPNAGEVLQEYVLAMQANVSIRTLGGTVHPYPTVAQANRRVANQYLSAKFLTPRTKQIVQFLARFRR